MFRLLALINIALFLVSCGSVPSSPAQTLKSTSKEAISSLSSANYIQYTATDTLRLKIDEDSQKFTFRSGTSNFFGLKIPEEKKYSIVEITTKAQGPLIPLIRVYIPTLSFLDSDFNEISTIEPVYYMDTKKLEDTRYGVYYASTFIPKNASYVIIYSDISKLSKPVQYFNGGSLSLDVALEKMSKMYKEIDKVDYAMGKVKTLDYYGFVPRLVKRDQVGEIRIALTPNSY